MKLRRRAFSIVARLFLVLGLWIALDVAANAAPGPSGLAGYTVTHTALGPSLHFTDADYVLADQYSIPAAGWRPDRAGLTLAYEQLRHQGRAPKVLWTRMRFDRAALGGGPLAIYTQGNRDRLRVFLNGAEIYRNFAAPADEIVAWYEPILIPIPQERLRAGVNDLTVCIVSRYDLGAGTFDIGPNSILAGKFRWMYLWRIDIPRKVNFAMVMLAYGALLYWIFGRGKFEFLVIGASSFLWFLSSYDFIFSGSPVGELTSSVLPAYLLFLGAGGTLLFCSEFVEFGHRRWVLATIAAAGLLLAGLHAVTGSNHLADGAAHLLAMALVAVAMALTVAVWRRSRSIEHLMLALILALFIAGAIHDFGRLWYVHAWNGLGFFLQPYDGFILCIAYLASFGRSSAAAFLSLRQLNADLEGRVIRARQELAVSEEKRRELEVASAIESERERLLREIHDGIGSNLVTALRIAEQQHQPTSTIRTLRRALSDLKITIDSLEPVEGDFVALLANLRHRMEGDLREAGLKCLWRVADCRPLPWLDATNALHVLRIFQEAVGNSLTHAGADTLEIGCHEEACGGRPGLIAYVADNGRGFDPEGPAAGKGIQNMRSRARALHGQFECVAGAGAGTRVSIWLPYVRDEPAWRPSKSP
ncbi:MAG TPA: ATP-binding protein [Caulobacteraceae bacterium]|nr:ATP-binding protein [Caulobacteraceae bacterium]